MEYRQTGNTRLLTTTPGDEGASACTPDGKALVFTSANSNRQPVTVRVGGLAGGE